MADEQLNPYASPLDLEAPIEAAKPRASVYMRPYISARNKANWAVGTAVVAIVLKFAQLVSCYMQLAMLQLAIDGPGYDDAAASANQARQLVVHGFTTLSAILSLVSLLIWIYAASANLPALKHPNAEFSPGWAVGWFFVPLMNLFKPYQVVGELWQCSDPASRQGTMPAGLALVGWWWCWRVLSAIFGSLVNAVFGDTESVEGLVVLTWACMVIFVFLDIPMLVMQTLVVLKIQRFQDERHLSISSEHAPTDFRDPLATFR